MNHRYRTALITGAGSGLGREMARQLATEGVAIAALDQNQTALDSLTQELANHTVATATADVRDAADMQLAVQKVECEVGPVDLLIACAGVSMETSAWDLQAADLDKSISTNLIGVANTIAAVLPGMMQRKSGHIAAISSLASLRGLPSMAGYCASKAGINALMDSFRVELRNQGVRFTTICPGWIRTPLIERLDISSFNMLEVSDAAARILKAIRNRKIFFAFPWQLSWRLRVLSWLPLSFADWLISFRLAKIRKQRKVQPVNKVAA